MKTGWEIKKIKDICDKASSNIAMNKITDIDGIYPVYGASGFVQNVDFFHRDTPYIGIVKDGAGVGRVNVYPAYSSLLGTLQYILPKEGNSINYVAYALKSLNLASSVTGATIPHIYFKDYGEITLPVPPLPEQERIVSELDLISGVIEKKKQQLKELDSLAQSVFYEMFGNPIENEKGWEVKKLKEVCVIERGGSPRPISAYITNSDDGVNWIKIGDAVEGSRFINHTAEKIKPEGVKKSRFVYKGDFILSNSMSFGKPYILGVDGCIHDGWLVLRDNNGVFDKSYLYYYLSSDDLYNEFAKLAVGGVVNNLNSQLVRGVNVCIPPLSLQQEFASMIESIEKQKELIKQSLKETETLFNSRMDYYFNS